MLYVCVCESTRHNRNRACLHDLLVALLHTAALTVPNFMAGWVENATGVRYTPGVRELALILGVGCVGVVRDGVGESSTRDAANGPDTRLLTRYSYYLVSGL